MIEMQGVMQLPPLKSTRSRAAPGCSTKWPAGGTTWSRLPTSTWSFIQLEMRPPSTRLIVTLCSLSVSAGAPTKMNHQGRLTDNTPSQNPIDTTVSMTFRIFPALTGGVSEWEETRGSVQVNQGIYSVLLGETVPLPATV